MAKIYGARWRLEGTLGQGGQGDVHRAIDISGELPGEYSLGKVIYYMYSGGTIIPRERIHEPQYSQVVDGTERARLLGALLRQMICDVGSRIQTMAEITSRLEQIENWEKTATLVPMTGEALSSIERMQRQALETARIQAENQAARQTEQRSIEDLGQTFKDWLKGELQKATSPITAGGILKCTIGEISSSDPKHLIGYAHNRAFRVRSGLELQFSRPDDERIHILQLLLCEDPGPIVTSVSTTFGTPKPKSPQAVPARDANFAFIPFYRNVLPNRPPNASSVMGYFAKNTLVGTTRGRLQPPPPARGRRGQPQVTNYRVAPITQTFDLDVDQNLRFKASEWPGNVDAMRALVTDAISSFLAFVEGGANAISI